MVAASFLDQPEHPAQRIRLEMDVRISKHQPLTGGSFVGLLERVRLAQPSRGQGIDPRRFQP